MSRTLMNKQIYMFYPVTDEINVFFNEYYTVLTFLSANLLHEYT